MCPASLTLAGETEYPPVDMEDADGDEVAVEYAPSIAELQKGANEVTVTASDGTDEAQCTFTVTRCAHHPCTGLHCVRHVRCRELATTTPCRKWLHAIEARRCMQ